MSKPYKAIVFCKNYNGHACHFMMKSDDFRFGTPDYVLVTKGKHDAKAHRFVGDNGKNYIIHCDWSAGEIKCSK